MPLSPTGQYTLPNGYLAVTGQDILPSNHNPPLEDIANVLSEAFYRTGVAPMLAQLNMNTFKVTNVAAGTAVGDAVNKSQLDSFIALTGNASGQVIRFPTSGITLQFASIVLTTNAGGGGFVTYPTPFIGSLPITVACPGEFISSSFTLESVGQALTGFTYRTFNPIVVSGSYRVNWLAIGIT